MARSPILAAGGIVFRSGAEPLIAVVRLNKSDDWVLPKGKLNEGETARAAAKREVWEETGHAVSVHEFLGKLTYATGGRQKVVHFWCMEAGERVRTPTGDVKDVIWLPLPAALKRLTRSHERNFLENIGPSALKGRGSNGVSAPASRSPVNGGVPRRGKRHLEDADGLASSGRRKSRQNLSAKNASNKRRAANASTGILKRLRLWFRQSLSNNS